MTTSCPPRKAREYENRFFDSTVWNELVYRDDDVVVASYAKAGTTLLQQIVAQLIFNGECDIDICKISPWVDSVYPDKMTKLDLLNTQRHRRVLKTHLPVDALVYSETAKYIYIGRDGRDIALSLYDHQRAISEEAQATLDGKTGSPGRLRVVAPPASSVVDYFETWVDKDGYPFWSFWESARTWWTVRSAPNVLFVHYANLIRDMPAEIQRIAAFADLRIDEAKWPTILRNCSFEYMRENAARYVPQGAGIWKDGGKAFFNKGQINRWLDLLPLGASAKYEKRAVAELGEECALWLATGELP